MKTFYKLLANNLIAGVTTNFVWFALTFWAYLETESVLATSIIGGGWAVLSAGLALAFGTYVDHHKKKQAMIVSSALSLVAFTLGLFVYLAIPVESLLNLSGIPFWIFSSLLLLGAVAANMRSIALSTCVTILVEPDRRDNANGLIGSIMGFTFAITSVFSGLGIGFLGIQWSLIIGIGITAIALVHMLTIRIPEKEIVHLEDKPSPVDFKGALRAVNLVPGLIGLILFTTFNNFLGGVFMSLMDAYGLSLVDVRVWGLLWGVLSFGFIAGGLIVAKKGLGKNPVKTILMVNIVLWVVCIFFTIRESIVLTSVGLFIYMMIVPAVEAAEQTVIQKVVPLEKQGRVFGFAQTAEQAASPLTAFLIGPIAQFIVIPFMSEGGRGADLIGGWFGVGPARGMALIFSIAGILGLLATLIAFKSNSYSLLSKRYIGNQTN